MRRESKGSVRGGAVMIMIVCAGLVGSATGATAVQAETEDAADSTWLTHRQLVDDVGELVDFLELTHPDPAGRAGKLAFHRRLHRLLETLPQGGMSRGDFHSVLQPFVAALGDGHTSVRPLRVVDDEGASGAGLPIDFTILAASAEEPVSALFVQGVGGELGGFVGSRLESVARVPTADLIERERAWEGYENDFGNLQNLVWRLWSEKGLRELIPEWPGGDSVTVTLRTPDGQSRNVTLARGDAPRPWDGGEFDTALELPSTRAGVPAYRFLDSDRSAALLRLDNTWAHREVFERLTKLGSGNLSWARSFYQSYHGEEAPDDTAALVSALPRATEIFARLVTDMRDAETETLIVDLRRNSGGSSMLVNMLLYYLHGRAGWSEFFGNFYTIRRLTSDDVAGVDSSAAGRFPVRVGDYDFSGEFAAGTQTAAEAGSEGYYRHITTSFAEELESSEHEAYYTPPNIVVVVGPRTFSGGFWVAASLRRMGARFVGVPSGQAGNAYANVKYITLTHSGITAGVSSRLFVLFPEAPGGMPVLPVDVPLTLERWRALNFDPNASILMMRH